MNEDFSLNIEMLCDRIDKLLAQKERVIFAIDGRCGSGKSTLAEALQRKYGCTVIHTDDFFLRPEQRTEGRYAEPGGNMDRERLLSEVLSPLSEGRDTVYRPFDCKTMDFADPVVIIPTPLTVVEGSYSMHPDLAHYYDLSLFLTVEPQIRKERIINRNEKSMADRFFTLWIPMEERYFTAFNIESRCDISLTTDKITFKK
ncbi:MAG: phosphoribulokinase [Clostridia bacterium]|nr:phosphoribulokinase [Clostridia bacterium]